MRSSLTCKFLFGFVLLFITGLATAQEQFAEGQNVDPPSRVARLQFMRGPTNRTPSFTRFTAALKPTSSPAERIAGLMRG